jgi:hypothetical protein
LIAQYQLQREGLDSKHGEKIDVQLFKKFLLPAAFLNARNMTAM